MSVSRAVLILAAAVAPAISASAAPLVRLAPAPIVVPHGPGESHAFWRGGEGDHDLWRHRHRQAFGGLIGVAGAAVEPGPEPTPSPFVVAAPVFVNVTFAPAIGPQREWTDAGPKLIEIGRSASPRGHLPLVVYGD